MKTINISTLVLFLATIFFASCSKEQDIYPTGQVELGIKVISTEATIYVDGKNEPVTGFYSTSKAIKVGEPVSFNVSSSDPKTEVTVFINGKIINKRFVDNGQYQFNEVIDMTYLKNKGVL